MIRVAVLYPNEPGSKFDESYYMEKHIPMVKQQLASRGLVRVEVNKGISGSDPNAPAPFIFIANLVFNTVEEVHEAFKATGREVMGDIPNYTDIKPQIQISEMVE